MSEGSRAPRASRIAAPTQREGLGAPSTGSEPGPSADQRPEQGPGLGSGEVAREVAAIFDVLGRGFAAAVHDTPTAEPSPTSPSEPSTGADLDHTAALLRSLSMGLLRYPAATQAVFQALVAEGRAYAETPTGAQLRASLLDAPSFRQLRRVYESLTWHMLEEGGGALPSAYFDALTQVVRLDHLEPYLAGLAGIAGQTAREEDGKR